jgi:hypothetical protein
MNRNISIQLKAAILIIVFSLNTVIGFACAIGIDMGSNATHPHEEETTEAVVHNHKDGKKHVHEKEAKHSDTKSHHHDVADNKKSKKSKDDCCNDKVIKFEQLDKAVAHSIKLFSPNFFLPFLSSFYDIDILYVSYVNSGIKYFVRSHHPPIPDIRIAIRSFQI